MSLAEFVADVRGQERTLSVFTDDDESFEELREFFAVGNVAVGRGTVEGGPDDFVVLHEAGEAVAVSTLADLRGALFLSGSGLSTDQTPDVLAAMSHTTFSVTGEDRLLLRRITNHLADMAHTAGGGFHAGLPDGPEDADRELYDRLLAGGVEVHCHCPGGEADLPAGVARHSLPEGPPTRFVAVAGDDASKAAMVAVERDGYEGFWTFDAALVDDVLARVEV